MLLNIIKQLNWVDAVIVFLLMKILYASIKNGFVVELFKTIGIVFSIYIAFHYFTALSDFLMKRVPEEQLFPLEFMDLLILVSLLLVVYLLFVLLRNLVMHFVKMEAAQALSKWGGFLLGILRGLIVSSLLVFLLFVSTVSYFGLSAQESYIGNRIFNISVGTYSVVWDGLMSKLVGAEKFNNTVTEIQKEYYRK